LAHSHSGERNRVGSYQLLHKTGVLAQRAAAAGEFLRRCTLCPRNCGVDREAGEVGACGIGADAVVSSYGPHFGEESVLVGRFGSGTVFLTGCNLGCVFCQNHEISQLRHGRGVSTQRLADMMLELQAEGCHNINFVSPTHQVPQILAALCRAADCGLSVPLVYNCGGYESVGVLRLLDGVFDIYMPDAKYGGNDPGEAYSGVPDYWDRCREAVKEMHRQVGDLVERQMACDDGGKAELAVRGLLVRHLVLPRNAAVSANVFSFLAGEISRETYLNVMAQYRPEYRASGYPILSRAISPREYREALGWARKAGLHRFAQ